MPAKLTHAQFVLKANLKHNYKYDYSEFLYVDCDTKGIILCPEHGRFRQKPICHLRGKGCPKCAKNYPLDRNTFIVKANTAHNYKYGYDGVNYINNQTKVTIECFDHGFFEQTPAAHLRGQGCPKCKSDLLHYRYCSNKEEFAAKSNVVHNYKYGYDAVIYVNALTKVEIRCFKHGMFKQTPADHFNNGKGCNKCGNEVISLKSIRNIIGEIPTDYWKRILRHVKHKPRAITITPEDIWQQYLKQDGKCALSGLPIGFRDDGKQTSHTASLDRIDSSRGYEPDNIQWVHKQINEMKSKMVDNRFIAFCILVTENYAKRQLNKEIN